jgi:pyruvate/2-oxoglutarate/acetoin dehydrogenase E1 component
MEAAELLRAKGIEADVVDLRSIRPLDEESLYASVRKTGRLSWWTILARASEDPTCMAGLP